MNIHMSINLKDKQLKIILDEADMCSIIDGILPDERHDYDLADGCRYYADYSDPDVIKLIDTLLCDKYEMPAHKLIGMNLYENDLGVQFMLNVDDDGRTYLAIPPCDNLDVTTELDVNDVKYDADDQVTSFTCVKLRNAEWPQRFFTKPVTPKDEEA